MTDWLGPGARRPEYPWQIELPPWAPAAKKTEAERRADFARSMFGWEKGWHDEGGPGTPGLFWDARAGFFRFGDGGSALSREHADWRRLKEMGCFSEWDM